MEPYPPAYEDVPASQIYMGKDVRKYGMLKKKTGGKKIPFIQNKYDQRFVVINKGWVYYYKDKSSEKRQGNFSLQGFSNTVINAEEEEATMTFVFKIYSKKANERTWYFATETRLDMEQWMEAFRLEIEQYNVRGIPNIRSSKSCPVNPLHSPGGLSRLDINNGRPQSVHTAAPRHDPLPGSVFSSRTDITSGIGSSTQSIEGEDFYEPVDDYFYENDDDEFETDSETEEYESPLADTAPRSNVPVTSRLRENPFPKYEPPPAVPPRDPSVASSVSTHHSQQLRQSSICEELKSKMVIPTSQHSDISTSAPSLQDHSKVLSTSPYHSPSVDNSNRRLPPTPTSYTPHTLPPSRPAPLLPGHLPVQFRHLQETRNESSHLPIHTRPRSEDPSERASKQPQHKRLSSPFAFMHETLAEQLATKLGQPTSPSTSRERNMQARPWSMAPSIPVHGEAIDPSYNPSSPRQQFSPRDWKTLPPLPETPHNGRSATIGPEDLPPRPPPAPPSHFQHIASPATHTPMHNILGYSKNNANKPYEYGVQRPSSSSREMLRGSPSPTAISQKHFSPLPSYPTYPKPQVPALPPKPSTPKDLPRNPHIGMLPFKPYPPNEQYYDDTADPPKYDDSDVETSVYDIPEEDSLYEPGLIEEMIYEQDQSNNKPLPPTPPLKPGKKYNMAPLLPQKPTAKHPAHPKVHQQSGNCRKSGLATSNFSNPNEKMTTVVEHGTKPTWQSKLKSTTAPHEAAAGNKAPWLTKLKPTEDLKVAATTTSAVYKAESRPSWVKDPTNAAVQKPVNISKSPWHKEEQQSGIKIMESKVPTSGFGSKPSTGMRPPLSQKPELSKPKPPVIKPSPPHKPAIKDNKPPTAQKPKPSVAHSLNVAKLRDRFVQQ